MDAAVRDISIEWCRYAWNCYLVWTTLSTEGICSKIRAVPALAAAWVVVCRIREEDGYAFLPRFLWQWLAEKV